jgi:hypothetical protein
MLAVAEQLPSPINYLGNIYREHTLYTFGTLFKFIGNITGENSPLAINPLQIHQP